MSASRVTDAYRKILLLDHGYVRLVEPWGHGDVGNQDEDSHGADVDYEVGIIEAARQSTQGSFRGWSEDAKLLHRLYTHRHATPFEFAGAIFEIQAPIFVFREWHRHRTQSYNEMSARYAPLPNLYYRPEAAAVYPRANTATTNKQAGQAVVQDVPAHVVDDWLEHVDASYTTTESFYQWALKRGIPKELARVTMPVGHYSRMRAAANLRNWLAFMTLRCAEGVQAETRAFAEAVSQIVGFVFPKAYSEWCNEPRIRCEKDHAPILHAEGPCPLCEADNAVETF